MRMDSNSDKRGGTYSCAMSGVFILLIGVSASLTSCIVTTNGSPGDYLTPQTDTGANTLSFLMNGRPWTAHNYNVPWGQNILSVIYKDSLQIDAFGKDPSQIDSNARLSLSMNKALPNSDLAHLAPSAVEYVKYDDLGRWQVFSLDTSLPYSIHIRRLDTTTSTVLGIASGTFSCTVIDDSQHRRVISDGRFDVRF